MHEALERFVEAFRKVLEATWDTVKGVDPYGKDSSSFTSELMCDWQQAQWEILVEYNLIRSGLWKGLLTPYSCGADSENSRFSKTSFTEMYEVCCLPKVGTSLVEIVDGAEVSFPQRGWQFDQFVGLIPGYYQERPPFDGVLLSTHDDHPAESKEWVFRREDVRFVLTPYNPRPA